MRTIPVLALTLAIAVTTGTAFAADISGRVTFDGEPPERRPLKMNADPKCVEIHGGTEVLSRDTLVSEDGGLANVFLYLETPPAGTFPTPSEPVILSQEGCLYTPRVQGIVLEQTLQIENADDTLHNVRALAVKNRPFNLGQPPATPPRKKTFKVVEPALGFKCDVHPWMKATVFVLDHPFYGVSSPDGSFRIADVPAGTYTVIAWHEKLGEQKLEVTVDGSGAELAVAFASAE
ncbi:MAG: TonB-dependent receptor [Thermoanaerobaculia bacterium]|nr:TonB-dependent receptor [Thermoanaerobaculia bacterium]